MTEDVAAPDAPSGDEPINLLPPVDDSTPSPEPAPDPTPAPAAPEGDPAAERPAWLPEKFRDAEALAAGYRELEKAYHGKTQAPEAYELTLPEGFELSEEDTAWLKESKLTNEQAQKVLDHILTELVPAAQEARVELHQERLGAAWGMEPKSQSFQQRLVAVHSWAKQNLPEAAIREMAQSANGVNALFQMMQAQEQGQWASSGPLTNAPARPSREELAALMNDPRYQHDDEYKNFVRRKFVEAYDT